MEWSAYRVEVAGGLTVLAVAGLAVWTKWKAIRGWAVTRLRLNEGRDRARKKQRTILSERVVDCAKTKGIPIGLSARGWNPVQVKYVDGGISNFFDRDHFEAYQAALQNYRYDRARTFYNRPLPPTIEYMTESEMSEWLRINCS
jgi:hypothetical protein